MSNREELFGHPKGLYVLFFTEMWERFSYYGMRAILVLYMASTFQDGGLGWTKASALELYGWYTMLVYVMSIPGGILADKLLGQKKSVMLGGLILVVGQSILAVDAVWAFWLGLSLIILGVGALKPNISTMVGQLYKEGDERRDKGFTIFYIGINIGALLSSLIVGYVGENIGWHYGFGLAGIGMTLGQLVYIIGGKKHLAGIGEHIKMSKAEKAIKKVPLTKIEKDRIIVLLLSFLIIIVFWGAFEQAGGLMNIYAKEKVNRMILGWQMPASWFQSFNSLFIVLFGTAVAAFWAIRKVKGKETSTLLKMGVGTIIMGAGFLLMAGASNEAGAHAFGKASFFWLVGAYGLHTIGELCASPTALSFITKLAPLRYASIMMGIYFAATGLGNKLAGVIGESSQSEPIEVVLTAAKEDLAPFNRSDTLVAKDALFKIKSELYLNDNNDFMVVDLEKHQPVQDIFKLKNEKKKVEIIALLKEHDATMDKPMHASFTFEKDFEAAKIKENVGDAKDYSARFVVEEVQTKKEFNTFMFIFGLTFVFGLLVIALLKKLKALTHGAEDLAVVEDKSSESNEKDEE